MLAVEVITMARLVKITRSQIEELEREGVVILPGDDQTRQLPELGLEVRLVVSDT